MSGRSESSGGGGGGEEMSKPVLEGKLRIALGLEREEGEGEMTNCGVLMKESEEGEGEESSSSGNNNSVSTIRRRRKFKDEDLSNNNSVLNRCCKKLKRESDRVKEMSSSTRRHKFNEKETDEGKLKKEELSWVAKAGFSLVSMDFDNWASRSGGGPPALYVRTDKSLIVNSSSSSIKPECRECSALDTCHSMWYRIPLETEAHSGGSRRVLSPVFGEMASPILRDAVAVALLPRIYVLGGGCYHRRSTQVFSYDITTPNKGWERRPNMRCPRLRPSPVAVDGKIYVFGGLGPPGYSHQLPYAEVYDPESDTWQVMCDYYDSSASRSIMDPIVPPHGGHALFIDQYHNKNLLVRTRSDSLFTYNTSLGLFSSVSHQHIPSDLRSGGQGAVVDDILYIYESCCRSVIAYDLTKARWFHEPVRGLSKGTELPNSYDESPFLIHIGNGRLCIVYATSTRQADDDDDVTNLFITCSVIRVSRITTSPSDSGEATLLASLECCKRYKLPGYDNELLDCLVL